MLSTHNPFESVPTFFSFTVAVLLSNRIPFTTLPALLLFIYLLFYAPPRRIYLIYAVNIRVVFIYYYRGFLTTYFAYPMCGENQCDSTSVQTCSWFCNILVWYSACRLYLVCKAYCMCSTWFAPQRWKLWKYFAVEAWGRCLLAYFFFGVSKLLLQKETVGWYVWSIFPQKIASFRWKLEFYFYQVPN